MLKTEAFFIAGKNKQSSSQIFFIRSKNNNKNRREMKLLSLSSLEICIEKAEFSDFKA